MTNFDNDPFGTKQEPTPESFENQSHIIMRNPIEVDLNQPDRAGNSVMSVDTGFEESKLIAEIKTPSNNVGIIHTQFPNLDPVIMLVGNAPEARLVLDPGDVVDVSEKVGELKCIVTLDESGKHLYVHAENPDGGYQIFTQELEQFQVPEHFEDDPEL